MPSLAHETAPHLRAGDPDGVDVDALNHTMVRIKRKQSDRVLVVELRL